MTEKSNYNRGKNWANEYFSKFRSFKKDSSGTIIGYKKSGSTEIIGKHESAKGYTGFQKGAIEEQNRIIASKPVKKRTTQPRTLSYADQITTNLRRILG